MTAVVDENDVLRFGNRQGFQNKRIEHTEDNGIGADTKREGDDCGHCKTWRFLQLAAGVGEIFGQVFEQADSARIPTLFFCQLYGSELTLREGAGFGFGHPAGGVISSERFDVKPDLPLKVRLCAAPSEKRAEAMGKNPA